MVSAATDKVVAERKTIPPTSLSLDHLSLYKGGFWAVICCSLFGEWYGYPLNQNHFRLAGGLFLNEERIYLDEEGFTQLLCCVDFFVEYQYNKRGYCVGEVKKTTLRIHIWKNRNL